MLKALIPYLSFSGQRILVHTPKHRNCVTHFSYFQATERYADLQFQAMNPMELLNDIRKFSYGENRKKLDQAVNMFAMLEMLMTINE